jgi:predicted MPP superfamily phosphohydrolase
VYDITTITPPTTRIGIIAACLAATAGAIASYAYFVEPYWLQVTHPVVRIPGLPAEFDGFRIAQLSDFHLPPGASKREPVYRAVEECNRAQADIVVLTGDYLARRRALPNLKDVLGQLTARPAFAVFGNHDYRFGRIHRRSVVQAFQDAGITVLDNASTSISLGDARLWLVGVGDGHTSHDRLSDAMCGLADVDRPRLLLTHYPDLLFELPQRSFDLAMAGHTHGAQVRLPYLTGLALRGSDTRFTSGLFEVNGIPLYVNRGLGTSTYRLRFGARPELTILTLRATTQPPG